MKKISIVLIILVFSTCAFAQKTEFRLALNSGLFSFGGNSTVSESYIRNYPGYDIPNYTNDVYSSKNGITYGLSFDIKRITKRNFIFGLNTGIEVLKNKIDINGVYFYGIVGPSPATIQKGSGSTVTTYNFINTNPFVGYRFNLNKISLDLTGGFDVSYCLRAHENGFVDVFNDIRPTTSVNIKNINFDFRPRIQLEFNFKKVGVYVGYSYGIVNYYPQNQVANPEAYSRLIRFGLSFKIK